MYNIFIHKILWISIPQQNYHSTQPTSNAWPADKLCRELVNGNETHTHEQLMAHLGIVRDLMQMAHLK